MQPTLVIKYFLPGDEHFRLRFSLAPDLVNRSGSASRLIDWVS